MKSKSLLAVILLLLCGQLVYAAGPTITSFSPASGQVGTLVTIMGTNLSSPTAFTIGGKAAIVISNTGTQLVGMVMPGAVNGPVSITVSGATATSAGKFTVNPPTFPTVPVAATLIGTESTYYSEQGTSVALSADGSTAIVGAENDNGGKGSSYVYTKISGVWTEQAKLVGTGEYINYGMQGNSVALSADGNTAMVGGYSDGSTYVNTSGFIWFFTRTGTTWAQQGNKLSGTGAVLVTNGVVFQGFSVSLSADGNTAIEGAPKDNGGIGAAWIFTRNSSGVWGQVGSKMVVTGGSDGQGESVAMSADGNTAIVGSGNGAYIYINNGGTWAVQGSALTVAGSSLGGAVALSADGNTALVGAPGDPGAWAFTRTGGLWSQFGTEFTFPGAINAGNAGGAALALSADGNTAVVGAPNNGNQDQEGGTWVYTRSGNNFINQGGFILAGGNNITSNGNQGSSIALNATGTTALVGAPNNNNYTGLAFVLAAVTPSVKTSAATNVAATTANINGYITTAGLTGTVDFEWGTDPNLVGATTTTTFIQGTNPVAINSYNVPFTSSISGLLPSTTYYFRIDGTNINGTANGAILSFTTPVAPPPSSTITFTLPQYATYGSTIVPVVSSTDPTTPIVYRTPDQTITVNSSEQLIATGVGPTYVVAIQYAPGTNTEEGHTTADITITPAPLTATADNKTINWGQPAPAFTASYVGFVNGDTPANLPYNAVPLFTTPYVTGNAAGSYHIFNGPTATGNGGNYNISYVDGTLTVDAIYPQPTATTTPPTNVTANGATLNGTVDDNGAATTVTIQYTTDFDDGTLENLQTATLTTGPGTLPAGSGNTNYAAILTGLQPNTTYYYIITGSNPEFTSKGNVESFTTPAALSPAAITFAPLSNQQYGATDFSLSATSTNTVTPITYTSSNTAAATIINGSIHIIGAGTTQITASQAASATYAAPTPVIQSFTITPAPLTITADNQMKVQGTANPVLTATYTTFVNGDSEANLATPPTLSTTTTVSSPTGNYPIMVNGATDNNYTISYKPGTLNVVSAPAAVTLTATTLSPTGATLNGTVNDEGANTTVQMQYSTAPDVSGAYNVPVSTGTSPIPAGTGTVSFTSVVNSLTPSTTYYYRIYGINNYGTTYGNIVSFTTPAVPLQGETITFNQPPAQTYGAANVAPGATSTNTAVPVTYSSSNPAVATIVNGQIHIITAGTTIITASQAGSAGYSPATPVMQSFTVTPAALTVTPGAQTMVYGSAVLPALTLSYKGFVNGDSQSSLTTPATAATTATNTSGTGTYPITAMGALDPNYTISYITNTLTITPAALTITADNSSKEYGSGNPDFSAGITGFVNGDGPNSLNKQPKLTTTAGTNSPAGAYPITAAGAADNNYTISYKPGTLTITPATLIITATNETKTYGKANPYLAVSYSGFIPGDDSTSLSPQPTATTTATQSSATGSYPITLAGAADNNYTISYKPGTLTITPASLTITANNQAKFVGTANPPLTITYTGFVNNDTQSNLSTQPTISTTATTASTTGTYPITVSGAKDNNYTITYQNGTLTVTPLLVLNPFPAKTYGDPDFNPNATGTNITYSSGNSGAATIVGGDIHITGAGTTVITASSGSVSVQQTLTINKAPLTITANDETKTYGQANPAFTLSYDKFVYSDDAANSLSTQPAISTTATNTSDVGTYPITVSGAAAGNYALTYIPGTLSITKATQTITFAPIPDQVEPATYDLSMVTATSGLPLTFTLSNNGIATISGTTLSSTAPGMETVTAGQAGNNDYEAAADVAQTYTIKEPDNGEVVVSQVVSPNGDGINDVLNVINIQNYPDNKLTLINRDGVKIYEATGYNNTSIVFDGHSSITGALQQQGTLLYLLQYRVNGQLKRKTGFTVLRY